MNRSWPFIAGSLWCAAVLLHSTVQRAPPAPGPPVDVALIVGSVGHRTAAASAAWALTVLHFSAAAEPAPTTIERGALTAHRLDPAHRVALAYGSGMLHKLHTPSRARRLLSVGTQQHPDDKWFRWALRMSTEVYPDEETK